MRFYVMLCHFFLSFCSRAQIAISRGVRGIFYEGVCEALCHLPAVNSSCWKPAVKNAQATVDCAEGQRGEGGGGEKSG